MEAVIELTKDIEKELVTRVKEIVNTIKKTKIEEAYKGIEELYDIKPLEGVTYDKCVMIRNHDNQAHFCAPCKLPEGEYVIQIKIVEAQQYNNRHNVCFAVTNFGRILATYPIYGGIHTGGYTYYRPISDTQVCVNNQPAYNPYPIHICEPLAYKLPKIAIDFSSILTSIIPHHSPLIGEYGVEHTKKFYETPCKITETLQKLCEHFYSFIGKWQPYINNNIEIDFDTMRQQFESQQKDIKLLESQVENLIAVNNTLESELQEYKDKYAKLAEEQKDYKELNDFKRMIIKHLDNHIDGHKDKEGNLYSTKTIDSVLSNHYIIEEYEWEKASNAMDEMEEFKKYQEMQKKFGTLGTTIKNTTIGVKKNYK